MKSPGMLNLYLITLKLKKMCKHEVEKMVFVIRYVPDQCKTQKMCDKDILENGRTLKSVRDCYKT